jgi:lipid II:glycine glycyltransferase (peptidoglycan interpeptide bridge formation enzyme)
MNETRQRQGSLPYSRNFFSYLYQLVNASQCKLYLAYAGSQPIAGLIIFQHGERAIYAYGASTNNRKMLQMRPNELLFWTSIVDAHRSGCSVYDFGITPLAHNSLMRFKSQWGPENRKLFYSYFLNRSKSLPSIDRSGVFATTSSKILNKLPIPILKSVGPVFLKILG